MHEMTIADGHFQTTVILIAAPASAPAHLRPDLEMTQKLKEKQTKPISSI